MGTYLGIRDPWKDFHHPRLRVHYPVRRGQHGCHDVDDSASATGGLSRARTPDRELLARGPRPVRPGRGSRAGLVVSLAAGPHSFQAPHGVWLLRVLPSEMGTAARDVLQARRGAETSDLVRVLVTPRRRLRASTILPLLILEALHSSRGRFGKTSSLQESDHSTVRPPARSASCRAQ